MESVREKRLELFMIKLVIMISILSVCQSREYLVAGDSLDPANLAYWKKIVEVNGKYTYATDDFIVGKTTVNSKQTYYIQNDIGYCISQDVDNLNNNMFFNVSVINIENIPIPSPLFSYSLVFHTQDFSNVYSTGASYSFNAFTASQPNSRLFVFTRGVILPTNTKYTKFSFCSLNHTYYVSRLSLGIPYCTQLQSNLTLASGYQACVPNEILTRYPSCLNFSYKAGSSTDFQCAQCDSTSRLVRITTGYKRCINISNIAYNESCLIYNYDQQQQKSKNANKLYEFHFYLC